MNAVLSSFGYQDNLTTRHVLKEGPEGPTLVIFRAPDGDWSQAEFAGERPATEQEVVAYRGGPGGANHRPNTLESLAQKIRAHREVEHALPDPIGVETQQVLRRLQEAPPPAFAKKPDGLSLADRLHYATMAGIPAQHIAHIRDGYDQDRRAQQGARKWYKSGKLLLLLHGGNQTGKSLAAACWLSTQQGGMWLSGYDLALACQPDPENKGVALRRRAKVSPCLVLDDVNQHMGPAGLRETEQLICAHVSAAHRVVVTTDLAPHDFLALFGTDLEKNRISTRWRLQGCVAVSDMEKDL